MNLLENVDITYYNISFNDFNIFFLNIRSIRYKKDHLEEIIELAKCAIHVIVIAETWFNSVETEFFNLNGYNAYHCTRDSGRGGRVTIFVKEAIL